MVLVVHSKMRHKCNPLITFSYDIILLKTRRILNTKVLLVLIWETLQVDTLTCKWNILMHYLKYKFDIFTSEKGSKGKGKKWHWINQAIIHLITTCSHITGGRCSCFYCRKWCWNIKYRAYWIIVWNVYSDNLPTYEFLIHIKFLYKNHIHYRWLVKGLLLRGSKLVSRVFF